MHKKYKILFLGETYRADAITWMNGLKEFGPFEIDTWELNVSGTGIKKFQRGIETLKRLSELKQKIKQTRPHLIIAERVTSYGLIGSLFYKYAPVIIAQQGITDIYPPDAISAPLKKRMQQYAFGKATLIHAWGVIMTASMKERGAHDNKIMILPKGIDLRRFIYQPLIKNKKLRAVVTRSLTVDYRHEIILSSFKILKEKQIPFELIIIGDGRLRPELEQSAHQKNISDNVVFKGSIPNSHLPDYLAKSDVYISMPCTEGVSASLFEAMAAGCYPVVTDLPGNRVWINDNINGKLIPVDDTIKLAEALEWYYNNRNMLQNVLSANRQLIEKDISYEKNMQIICERYLQIINGKT